jgi:hypothetical protein
MSLTPLVLILFPGHIAIYAGVNDKGQDVMWTTHSSKDRTYALDVMQYWPTPKAYFRYQVPTLDGIKQEGAVP